MSAHLNMPNYELLYIIPAQYTDAELPAVQKKVTGILEKAEVKISRHDHAGKLKLAYPMKGHRYGHYMLVEFRAEPSVIAKITTDLRLATEVVRAEVVRVEEGIRAPGPRTIVSHEEAGFRAREAAAPLSGAPAPVAAPIPVPTKPSLTSEQLEQKIEEILNEQVV